MDLWNTDTAISDIPDLGLDVPAWISPDISPYDVAGICQGGCESGAYMPAVTYHAALKIMAEHGDDVMQYIEVVLGELPAPPSDVSWSGLAVFYLSTAVELWASSVESILEEYEPETEQEA